MIITLRWEQMRTYILTEHERKIVERFLENGEKLDGFRVLLYNIRKAKSKLELDLMLISDLIAKIE